MRRVLVLVLAGLAASPTAAQAHDPGATSIVQRVTHEGRTVTMRLTKVPLRGPHFELRVQQADGSYAKPDVPIGERAFLGTVDEDPAAVASGIVLADGRLRGSIVFDRGGTWFTLDSAVAGTRGLDAPTYAWPGKPNLAAGKAGTVTRGWDLAVDSDSEFHAEHGASVPVLLDLLEYGISNVRALYAQNALLQPRLARVILRTSAARDPFTGTSGFLGQLRDHWRAEQTDAVRDEVVLVSAGGGTGGVAYRTDLNPAFAYADSGVGDDGTFDVVARHEIGHNFDVSDNHAGGPEGRTVMEGNRYARFGGPELQTILETRDARPTIFDDLGRFGAVGLPPYAGLDLADDVPPGGTRTLDVLANDHDANGQAIRLLSVTPRTAAGGTASLENGKVVYRAPGGTVALDSFSYVIADTCGQTATGVVLARTGSAAPTSSRATTSARAVPLLDSGSASCEGLEPGATTQIPVTPPTSGTSVPEAARRVTGLRVRIHVTRARREGGVTVWPCGQARPRIANLQVSRGQSAANDAVVRFRTGGRVCIASTTGGRVRLDLRKVYVAPRDVVAVAPLRVARARARSTSVVRVAGRRGVRGADRRIALNVSIVRPTRSGALRVVACGRPAPRTPTLRFTRGRSVSRLVLLAPAGRTRLCLSGVAGQRVLVDLQGRQA